MEYLILIIALAGIVFGADFLVAGSVSIARKYKVSDFVIGVVVGIVLAYPCGNRLLAEAVPLLFLSKESVCDFTGLSW